MAALMGGASLTPCVPRLGSPRPATRAHLLVPPSPTNDIADRRLRDPEFSRQSPLRLQRPARGAPGEVSDVPIEDDPDLGVGQLSGASDRAVHDRLPSQMTQATLPAPGAHHAAAQPSQAALRACKLRPLTALAQAWTARTA